jgi:hypothetical protein
MIYEKVSFQVLSIESRDVVRRRSGVSAGSEVEGSDNGRRGPSNGRSYRMQDTWQNRLNDIMDYVACNLMQYVEVKLKANTEHHALCAQR